MSLNEPGFQRRLGPLGELLDSSKRVDASVVVSALQRHIESGTEFEEAHGRLIAASLRRVELNQGMKICQAGLGCLEAARRKRSGGQNPQEVASLLKAVGAILETLPGLAVNHDSFYPGEDEVGLSDAVSFEGLGNKAIDLCDARGLDARDFLIASRRLVGESLKQQRDISDAEVSIVLGAIEKAPAWAKLDCKICVAQICLEYIQIMCSWKALDRWANALRLAQAAVKLTNSAKTDTEPG